MTATYNCIATTTLSSDAATVTFSSISGSFTDLVLIIAARNSANANEIYGRFNSDTGSNYSYTQITGNGSNAGSGQQSNSTTMRFGFSNNDNKSNAIVEIMNYSNTTNQKTAIARITNPEYQNITTVNLWRSTAAITSITLSNESATNFNSGSTFSLYGIKAE